MSKKSQHGRSVQLDSSKLTDLMNRRGLSVEELAHRSQVSIGTVNNLLAGKPVYRKTAVPIAKALEVRLDSLLTSQVPSASLTLTTVHEYLVADVLTDWQTASNGLKFQICRMRHLELDRQARGKRFDLRDLSTDDAQRCRTWIKRHPSICEKLSGHPNIIRNLTAFHDPNDDFYWVIDEWIEGELLQRYLNGKPFTDAVARQLLLDIAHGLQALHGQGIVRRELSPASILIRQDDGRAILTEFELAKLIDRGPTVSTNEWPVDPYRAGEADSDDVDLRADIYSWGRIGIHALLGELPEIGEEAIAISKTSLPASIVEMLLQTAGLFRSSRPETFNEIIPTIEEWNCHG